MIVKSQSEEQKASEEKFETKLLIQCSCQTTCYTGSTSLHPQRNSNIQVLMCCESDEGKKVFHSENGWRNHAVKEKGISIPLYNIPLRECSFKKGDEASAEVEKRMPATLGKKPIWIPDLGNKHHLNMWEPLNCGELEDAIYMWHAHLFTARISNLRRKGCRVRNEGKPRNFELSHD